LLTRWQFEDGRVQTNARQYHHTEDGWRQVISGKLVDKLGSMARNANLDNYTVGHK